MGVVAAALPALTAAAGSVGTALSAAAPFLSIASTAFGVLGAVQDAKAQRAQLNYQSAVEHNNAIIAEQNAQFEIDRANDARARGVQEELQHRRKVSQLVGDQYASIAASGAQVFSGSPLDLVNDTVVLGEADAQTIRQNAAREALGYEQNAYNLRYESQNRRAQAGIYNKSAKNISPFMAGSTKLLDGVSTLASTWDKYRTKKA